ISCVSESLPGMDQRFTDSSQFTRKDSDDMPGVAGDDGRTGQSLYAWALEVNHINTHVDCGWAFRRGPGDSYVCLPGIRHNSRQAELVFNAGAIFMKRY